MLTGKKTSRGESVADTLAAVLSCRGGLTRWDYFPGFSASSIRVTRCAIILFPSYPRKIRDEKCRHHAFALRSAQSETHSQIENLYYQGRSIAARCIPHMLYAVVENLSALES
jgi:hypothetical protein